MTAPATPDREATLPAEAVAMAGLEGGIARLLQTGTYVAIGLIAVGTVLMLVHGLSPADQAPALDPGRLVGDLLALRPEGFLWLGLLVVLLTPAARGGEREMATVAALILVVVVIGIALGTAAA